jgi:acyl-coenzyme A synthetase/AMP-(fatty) acid ligase
VQFLRCARLYRAAGHCPFDSWDPQKGADLIERFAVTSTAGTPFHFVGLMNLDDIRGKLATLREFLAAATTVTEEQGRQAHAFGINTYRSYGLTEHPTATASRMTSRPPGRHRRQTVAGLSGAHHRPRRRGAADRRRR